MCGVRSFFFAHAQHFRSAAKGMAGILFRRLTTQNWLRAWNVLASISLGRFV
jgi:hypothetical protein